MECGVLVVRVGRGRYRAWVRLEPPWFSYFVLILVLMQPTTPPKTNERIGYTCHANPATHRANRNPPAAVFPGKLWAVPSPPNHSPKRLQHHGPDHRAISVERCAAVRNRFFSRGGSELLRHVPARYFMHNPARPGNRAGRLHRHRRPQRRCLRSHPPWVGACVTLRIWCRPLRRAAIRTRFPTRCRFGRRLTAAHIASSLAQYY